MTNEQLQVLKKYLNMSAVIKSLPVKIPNVMEKLAGSNGKGKGKYHKERIFTPSELLLIESVLLAIAHQINENIKSR